MGARGGPRLGSRYRVERKLGEGTFGEVYLVRDKLLQRDVALKRFKERDVDFDVREMLREEFLMLSRLRHPGLPRVYDVSVGPGAAFFTMEHLAGSDILRSLRGLIRVVGEDSLGVVIACLSGFEHVRARDLFELQSLIDTFHGGDFRPGQKLAPPSSASPAAHARDPRAL